MNRNYVYYLTLLFAIISYGQAPPTVDWSYTLPDKIDRTGPAIANDGTVYIACNLSTRDAATPPAKPAPNFFAINPDGTKKWETSISEGNFTKPDAILSSPSINTDGSIYMGGQFGRIVFRLNPMTGDTIRTRHIDTRQRYTAPAFAVDGSVYICGYSKGDRGIRSLSDDLTTENWVFGAGSDFNSTPAVASDGTIYAVSTDDNIYAINPTDGIEKWRANYGDWSASAIALGADGTVYLSAKLNSDGDGVLKAYNPTDGSEKWSVTLIGANVEQGGPAIADDGTIYLGNKGGRMKAYSPTDGSELWSYPLAADPAIGGIEVVPAIDNDGKIYFGSTDGMFYVLNSDGTEAYTPIDLGDRIDSSVAIASDGTVYVGSTDGGVGKLNALQTTATGPALAGWPMYGRIALHTSNVDEVLSTKKVQETEEFYMYPNPVKNGAFVVVTKGSATKTIEILNLSGKTVFYTEKASHDNRVNVSGLRSGVYVIKVTEGTRTVNRKLIIE